MTLVSATQKLLSSTKQAQRTLRLVFPKGDAPDGVLLVANRLDAYEALSRDFHYTVEVLSDSPDVALKDVMGKMVTVELVRDDGSLRYFNGHVFDFRFVRNDAGFSVYDMVLLPWAAFLRYRKDNYLFHGLNVEQQTGEIFAKYEGHDWRTESLSGDEVMTDACQFDETDYNYVHRRWEALGWSYWYEHRKDGHTLVLCGDTTEALPLDGPGHLVWKGQGQQSKRGLWAFSAIRTLASTSVTASSFDFKQPRPMLANNLTVNEQGDVPAMELYEYTGAYGFQNGEMGQTLVKRRLEEIEAASKHFQAAGDDEYAQCGRTFQLKQPDLSLALGDRDAEFLILEVRHQATNNHEINNGTPAEYSSSFTCLRKKIPWRPGRGFNSTEPRIYGLQTAIVVGPEGEEIHTDEYGRVRVQFHWDREGAYDENSSAFVRVATPWAGNNFGMVAVPRIGDEVVVSWLDGNPDRPLIVGCVPNQERMPPWTLPDNKTQTGILTRSTPGGAYQNANALRFEDKKGEEQLWIHAEKNQDIEVENDETHWVGNDRSKTIDRDETVQVKRHRTETVDGNETITVHESRKERVDHNETISIGDNRTEDVGQNETVTIGSNRSVTIGGVKTETIALAKAETIGLGKALTIGGAYQKTVGAFMNTTVALAQAEEVGLSKTVKVGKSFTLTAGDEIELNVGKSRLHMDKNGNITLSGVNLVIDTSKDQKLTAKGNMTLKAKKIQEN